MNFFFPFIGYEMNVLECHLSFDSIIHTVFFVIELNDLFFKKLTKQLNKKFLICIRDNRCL